MKLIKKIKIKTVETFLGITLKSNIISIGWDVSMRSTGIAVIRTTDSYLIIEILDKIIISKNVEDKDALDLFIDQVDSFAKKISQIYKIDYNIIEDCFYGNNVRTLKALARHSALVYDRFRRLSRIQYFLLPTVARSRIKFKKSSKKIKGHALKKEVIEYINVAIGLKLKSKDNDICDSIVLALAGLKEE